MSFTDRLVLWLHVGFVIFAIGPVAVAISSTPRYIRRRELPVVRYLSRITTIFTIASLGVLVMGIIAAQQGKDFSHPWLTASMTLYVVALVLLVLIIRDQRKAISALDGPVASLTPAAATAGGPAGAGAPADAADELPADGGPAQPGAEGPGPAPEAAAATAPATAPQVATVERGRIAMLGGLVNLIWLIILVLMIWNA
jgi:hypothetical protein